MAWRTITPEVDAFTISPVIVDAAGWRYPGCRLRYDAPIATVTSPQDVVWLEAVVTAIEQDDQLWRVHLDDGATWEVSRPSGRGCACGGGSAPTPIV